MPSGTRAADRNLTTAATCRLVRVLRAAVVGFGAVLVRRGAPARGLEPRTGASSPMGCMTRELPLSARLYALGAASGCRLAHRDGRGAWPPARHRLRAGAQGALARARAPPLRQPRLARCQALRLRERPLAASSRLRARAQRNAGLEGSASIESTDAPIGASSGGESARRGCSTAMAELIGPLEILPPCCAAPKA